MMSLSTLIYASLVLLLGTEISANLVTEQLAERADNGLLPLSAKSLGQRIEAGGSFAMPLDSDSLNLEPASHEPIGPSGGKSVKNHLLAQQEFPLLIADHFARLPAYSKLPSSKYLLKPFRELGAANSLLSRVDEMSTSARARRYAYPMSSQSFLRFGRRYKRPKDTKDTAFLRFGRANGPLASGADQELQSTGNEDIGTGFQ